MEPTSKRMGILALAPNWLGDAAMCTPALRALRRRYPEAWITVAGRVGVCALLEGLPWIDALFPLPARPGAAALVRLARQLRPFSRDLALVFPHSFRAAWLARLCGARERLGYARNGRGLLLTRAVPPYREGGQITPIYMAREYLDLARHTGAEDDGQGLELAVSEVAREATARALAGDGPLVCLAPGAAFGPSKRWPAEHYAMTADRLSDLYGARSVLLTGPGEEETRAAVLRHARRPLLEPPRTLPGIAALKAAIAQCDLLIGNDSGPRHVAVAFNRPVICIMGPTSPRYSEGPRERGRVLRLDVDCSPCQKPVCPIDHRCMMGILPEVVLDAARPWMEASCAAARNKERSS